MSPPSELEQNLISLLRGTKRCEAVRVGTVNFYHLWRHKPISGLTNVPWVKDLRCKQFAMSGYVDRYLQRAQQYLVEDRASFYAAHTFVAPTKSFAEDVMRWYACKRPWIQFCNYPSRIRMSAGPKRPEVVYVDYSTALFQEDLYRRIIAFFDELHVLAGVSGVIVAGVYLKQIRALPHRKHVRILNIGGSEYDYRSKFGLLCNLTNFPQAGECLPRKLLLYLHCGMTPLVHGTFAESIAYCRRWNVQPAIYYDADDAADLVGRAWPAVPDRGRFCIQERIGDLVAALRAIGGR